MIINTIKKYSFFVMIALAVNIVRASEQAAADSVTPPVIEVKDVVTLRKPDGSTETLTLEQAQRRLKQMRSQLIKGACCKGSEAEEWKNAQQKALKKLTAWIQQAQKAQADQLRAIQAREDELRSAAEASVAVQEPTVEDLLTQFALGEDTSGVLPNTKKQLKKARQKAAKQIQREAAARKNQAEAFYKALAATDVKKQ